MRIKEIELSAAKNKPIPDYMTSPEMCLYESLRALYLRWRRNEITRDAAQVEKRKIIAHCERYEAEYIAWTDAAEYYQDNIRKAGTLIASIERSHDIREIALTACECIGRMVNDMTFLERQRRKIK